MTLQEYIEKYLSKMYGTHGSRLARENPEMYLKLIANLKNKS